MSTPNTTVTSAKGNWDQQKAKLKAKFNTLKDSDLAFEAGKKDAMMTKLQTKLGKTKEELAAIITGL